MHIPTGFSGFHQRPGDFVDASYVNDKSLLIESVYLFCCFIICNCCSIRKLPGGTALTQSSDFSISARLRVTGRLLI